MIQPQTQTKLYWVSDFKFTESDIEQLYNYFLEIERPQPIEEITRAIMSHRVAEDKQRIEQCTVGHTVYQPQITAAVGDKLVFPLLNFAQAEVESIRSGSNPELESFSVISVTIQGTQREFATNYAAPHALSNFSVSTLFDNIDIDTLYKEYGELVAEKIETALHQRDEFVRLGGRWFVKGLMINLEVTHLHLANVILQMNEGGPLPTNAILEHLDLDNRIDKSVQEFSLNYALWQDDRFDEVAPRGQIAWFLREMEPREVQDTPERLVYSPIEYDYDDLPTALKILERELDDELSEHNKGDVSSSMVVIAMSYPHLHAGTLPLTGRTRPMFPIGQSTRLRVLFVDDTTGEEIPAWVLKRRRYVCGLGQWFKDNKIPVGGFVHLQRGDKPHIIKIGYDRRRRAKREWVRIASVSDNRLRIALERREIGCGYDDLLIIDTDYEAAVDLLWQRTMANNRSLASLLMEIVPALINLSPQQPVVHAKTIYSVVNLLRRVPPGPIFAELVRNPAFEAFGDYYWMFTPSA